MNDAMSTRGRNLATVLAATLTAALTSTAAGQAQTPATPGAEGDVPMSPEQLLAPPVEEVPRQLTVGAGAEAAGNREDLGLRQESWEAPTGNMGPGQQRPGYRLIVYDPRNIETVYGRTGMWTMVVIDPRDYVHEAKLGDGATAEARIEGRNVLWIRPLSPGLDTSVHITAETETGDGVIYSAVLITTGVTHGHTTDVRVDWVRSGGPREQAPAARAGDISRNVSGREIDPGNTQRGQQAQREERWNEESSESTQRRRTLSDLSQRNIDMRPTERFGNLRTESADPSRYIHDRIAFGNTQEAIDAIAPVAVYRDDRRTYLDYRGRTELPEVTVLEVRNDSEKPISKRRWGGEDGMVVGVDSVRPLVLRAGQHVVCIRPSGEPARKPRWGEPVPMQTRGQTVIAPATRDNRARPATTNAPPARDTRAYGALRRGSAGTGRNTTRRVNVRLDGDSAMLTRAIGEDLQGLSPTQDAHGITIIGVEAEIGERICAAALAAGGGCRIRVR